MAKKNRITIKLVCKKDKKHYYTTTKSKKDKNKKLKLRKYNPTLKKHVIYEEKKIK